jgi:hypothetical protein
MVVELGLCTPLELAHRFVEVHASHITAST